MARNLGLPPSIPAAARRLGPLHEREVFGRIGMVFDGRSASELSAFGEVRTPSLSDLFVAVMQDGAAAAPAAPAAVAVPGVAP